MDQRILKRFVIGSGLALFVLGPFQVKAQQPSGDPASRKTATDGRAQPSAEQAQADPGGPAAGTPNSPAPPDDAAGRSPPAGPATKTNPESSTSPDSPATEGTAKTGPAEPAGPTAATESQPQPSVAPSEANVGAGSGLFEQSQADAAATAGTAASQEERSFELGGYVRSDLFVGKVPGRRQGMMKAGYGEVALKFRMRKERYGDAYAEARLREGLESDARSTVLDIREAYVNTYLGPLDLRLGKQIIVWGRADAFNPTNNLTPADLHVRSPVEDDRRLGNIGARAFLNFAPVRIEGVWMPLYSATVLPHFQLPEYIYFGDPTYPTANLKNGLGAGRVHLELSKFEISASFLHGYAPLPGLTLQSYTHGVTPTVIRVSRTAYDQNVVGFDFSTAIGDFLGVRGEAAYRRPVDYKNRVYAPRPDLQYVLGVDHAFGSVSVIAQYMGRYVFDWKKENGPANAYDPSYLSSLDVMPDSIERQINDTARGRLAQTNQMLFQQTARVQHLSTVRVEWLTLRDTLSLSALGMVNFTTREWIAAPKIGYQISDHMSTAVGGEIFIGPNGTVFGVIKEEMSAGYAELRYSF
jgi:hypothetical protein